MQVVRSSSSSLSLSSRCSLSYDRQNRCVLTNGGAQEIISLENYTSNQESESSRLKEEKNWLGEKVREF